MSVSSTIPEVVLLRRRVEETFGASLHTHNAFIALADAVEAKLREHISESTLERLWGYSTRGMESVSIRTLDVLSRYAGTDGWDGFRQSLKDGSLRESEEFLSAGIDAAALAPGACLLLGWLPDRIIRVRYLGNLRFEVIHSDHSSLAPGDTFSCLRFQMGRPLYLDHFRRAGSASEANYVAGERHGLVQIEQVSDSTD